MSLLNEESSTWSKTPFSSAFALSIALSSMVRPAHAEPPEKLRPERGSTGASRPTPGDAASVRRGTTMLAANEVPSTSNRPSEGEMFADPGAAGDAAAATSEADPNTPRTTSSDSEPNELGGSERDQAILGGESAAAVESESALPGDTDIGGLLYLQAQSTIMRHQPVSEYSFTAPFLLDVYLDARPHERIRGFVLTRVGFEAANSNSAPDEATAITNSAAAGAATLDSSGSTNFAIDQMFVNFDAARSVFFTAGRQHVRWGTGRYWNPTDYLHAQKRNAVSTFDARLGTTMVKAHVPIESLNWNFYAYGIMESPSSEQGLSSLSAAARAEFVFDTTEVALGALTERKRKPKFAADISTGLGVFDFHGEVALFNTDNMDRLHYEPDAELPAETPLEPWDDPTVAAVDRFEHVLDAVYPSYRKDEYVVQAVAGLDYQAAYGHNDSLTLGVEYFYNQVGYDSSEVYPGLFLPRSTPLESPATFFYLGRHYYALSASLPAPGSLDDHSIMLSTICNMSDRSFLSRLDYSYTFFTSLQLEAFASVRYGDQEGEFRFGLRPLELDGEVYAQEPTVADFGLALRLKL